MSSTLNLGLLKCLSSLLYRMDKKSEFFIFFGIKCIEQFGLELSVVTN